MYHNYLRSCIVDWTSRCWLHASLHIRVWLCLLCCSSSSCFWWCWMVPCPKPLSRSWASIIYPKQKCIFHDGGQIGFLEYVLFFHLSFTVVLELTDDRKVKSDESRLSTCSTLFLRNWGEIRCPMPFRLGWAQKTGSWTTAWVRRSSCMETGKFVSNFLRCWARKAKVWGVNPVSLSSEHGYVLRLWRFVWMLVKLKAIGERLANAKDMLKLVLF